MQSTTRKIVIGIILAILVHLIIITFLFMNITFKGIFLSQPPPDEHANELKKDWAARQPPPVIFYDEPDEKAPIDQKDLTNDEIVPEIESATSTPTHIENTTTQEAPRPEPFEHMPQQTITEAMLKLNEPLEETPEKIIEKPRVPEKTKPATPPAQQKKAAQQAKRRIRLEDITQSFMEKMGNIPTGTLFMQGAVDNLPPDKQIIFERYRQKVGAIIDQVYKEHPLPISHLPSGLSVQLYLALDKTGRFKDIRITHSSGIAAIDDFCLSVYARASQQFPPIPESLDESLFKGVIRLQSYQRKAGERHSGNWFLFQ